MDNYDNGIEAVDLTRFRKIRYYVEGARVMNPTRFATIAFLCALAVLFGLLLEPPWRWILPAGLMSVCGIMIFFMFTFRKTPSTRMYVNAHRKIMEQGVFCPGTVTGTRLVQTESHDLMNVVSFLGGARGTRADHYYCYLVEYTDPDGVVRNTETYVVQNFTERNVGKRCAVYYWQGKAIVDAIEK